MRLRTGIVCLLMMYLSLSLNAGVACVFSSPSLDSVPMGHSLSFGYIGGNSGDRAKNEHGFDIKYSFQLRLTSGFATGIGTGWTGLTFGSAEQVFPFFLRLGYQSPGRRSAVPYFVLDTGVGIPANNGDGFVAVQGGLYLNPSVGLNIPIGQATDMRIGCGYLHQRMSFQFPEGGRTIRERVDYHRLKLFIGVLL